MAPKSKGKSGREVGIRLHDSCVSPDNFRVSLSNMIVGVNPVEPREVPTRKHTDPEPDAIDDLSSAADRQSVNICGSEQQSDQAASASESEDRTSSAKSSSAEGSSSNENSASDHKKAKRDKNKDRVKKAAQDSASSGTDLATSGDSEHETSSGEDRRPKGKSKKKGTKATKSGSTDSSEATSESVVPDDTGSSAATSSAKLDSSSKADNASTDASTSGEKSSQEAKSNASEGDDTGTVSGTSEADNSGWSISEDFRLRGMKEGNDGISWAEIGTALNREKNEVKARWKVIKGKRQNTTSDEAEPSQTKETSSAPRSEPGQEADVPEKQADGDEDEENIDRGGKGAKGKGKSLSPTRWHSGKRNDKVAVENKAAKSKASRSQPAAPAILSGEEASSESVADSEAFVSDASEEERRQDRYMQDHVLPQLYPALIYPRPSASFDERDCAVLAAVDSKYKRSKWLEMQANFYNVTGRMVPLDVIRTKCEQAEDDEERKRTRREGVDGRKKVERWVSSIAREHQEDPVV